LGGGRGWFPHKEKERSSGSVASRQVHKPSHIFFGKSLKLSRSRQSLPPPWRIGETRDIGHGTRGARMAGTRDVGRAHGETWDMGRGARMAGTRDMGHGIVGRAARPFAAAVHVKLHAIAAGGPSVRSAKVSVERRTAVWFTPSRFFRKNAGKKVIMPLQYQSSYCLPPILNHFHHRRILHDQSSENHAVPGHA